MMELEASCGCCEGVEKITPADLANRPGLNALAYRAGTYSTFFETMVASLSNVAIDIPTGKFDQEGRPLTNPIFPLSSLTTRDPSDPAIALLDAWAVVADVLTFYQERLANEGYLSTATERRSVLELARLVGYALRPGVASTVYLAYTIEEDRSIAPLKSIKAVIPEGSRAQSVPGPGELPQPFETSDPLEARTEWNSLQPRLMQPQTRASIFKTVNREQNGLYLKGTATNLKPNDALLIDFGAGVPVPYRVQQVIAETPLDRTRVILRDFGPPQSAATAVAKVVSPFRNLKKFGVSKHAEMTKRVLAQLDELEALAGVATPAEVASFIGGTVLPMVKDEHAVAMDSGFSKQEPWLGQMIGGIGTLRDSVLASAGPPEEKRLTAIAADQAPAGFFDRLGHPPSIPPPNALRLPRAFPDLEKAFEPRADFYPQLLTKLRPELESVLFSALENVGDAPKPAINKVYVLRVAASLFGHNAPKRQKVARSGEAIETEVIGEWPIVAAAKQGTDPPTGQPTGIEETPLPTEEEKVIYLDSKYDKIVDGDWVVVDTESVPGDGNLAPVQVIPTSPPFLVTKVKTARSSISRAEYGISGPTTRLELDTAWIKLTSSTEQDDLQPIYNRDFQVIRRTAVYAQTEELATADEPITDDVCDGATQPIELDGLHEGLKPGRWLIVAGERTDVLDTEGTVVRGIHGAELVMLNVVRHGTKRLPMSSEKSGETVALPGDKTHTFLTLSHSLAYCYKRDTLIIYGNVVKATHGETRIEVLGNGDGSKPMQTFALRQSPLTYLSAGTPDGAASTLVVRVNDVQWHETDSLAGLKPADRLFFTETDDESKTKIVFGNGREGARPPTGLENIRAVYRTGIGKPGNVTAGQVSLLASRPLGVKEVINPLRASGGADRESRDQARQNAPLALLALDRLVSLQDYTDFSRTFAGIGKARAAALSDGRRRLVHVTIAGADDIPIDPNSDLYRNLSQALRDFGDPQTPVALASRELLSLIVSAKVRLLSDYEWESVEPMIRLALLDGFGFSRRELGQDVTPSEVISTIQRVRGVACVDLDLLTSIDAQTLQKLIETITAKSSADALNATSLATLGLDFTAPPKRVIAQLARPDPEKPNNILAAQLATFSPEIPDTLILSELPQ
jgi:Baseplate J-like protein